MGWRALAHLWWHPTVGVGVHDGLMPPAMAECKLVHFDIPVTITGLTLMALPSAEFFTSGLGVFGPGQHAMIGRMNDAGPPIVHISVPPQPLMVITSLLGQSQVVLGASKAKLPTKNWIFGEQVSDTGCCVIPNFPMSINFACNDPVPLPSDIVVYAGCSTLVDVCWMDLLAAMLDMAFQMLLAFGFRKLGKKITKSKNPFMGPKAAKAAGRGGDDMFADVTRAWWRTSGKMGKVGAVLWASKITHTAGLLKLVGIKVLWRGGVKLGGGAMFGEDAESWLRGWGYGEPHRGTIQVTAQTEGSVHAPVSGSHTVKLRRQIGAGKISSSDYFTRSENIQYNGTKEITEVKAGRHVVWLDVGDDLEVVGGSQDVEVQADQTTTVTFRVRPKPAGPLGRMSGIFRRG